MKNKFIILIVLIFVFINQSSAYSAKYLQEENGYDWEKMTAKEQLAYCTGFMNGVSKVNKVLSIFVTTSKLNEPEPVDINKFLPVGNRAVGEIAKGLDEFYKDDLKKNILIQNAFFIVCNELHKHEDSGRSDQEKDEQGRLIIKTRKDYYSYFIE